MGHFVTVYYLKKMQEEDRRERTDWWEVLVCLLVCFAVGFLIHLMYQAQKKDDVYQEVIQEEQIAYFAAALLERPDMKKMLADKRKDFTLIVPVDKVVQLSSARLKASEAEQENIFAQVEDYIFMGYISPHTLTIGNVKEIESLSGKQVAVTRRENFDRHLLEVNGHPIHDMIYADNGVIFLMNAEFLTD